MGIIQNVSVKLGSDFELADSGASGETSLLVLETGSALTIRNTSVTADITCSGKLSGFVGRANGELRVIDSNVSGRLLANESAGVVGSSGSVFYGQNLHAGAVLKGKRAAQVCVDASGVF